MLPGDPRAPGSSKPSSVPGPDQPKAADPSAAHCGQVRADGPSVTARQLHPEPNCFLAKQSSLFDGGLSPCLPALSCCSTLLQGSQSPPEFRSLRATPSHRTTCPLPEGERTGQASTSWHPTSLPASEAGNFQPLPISPQFHPSPRAGYEWDKELH